jgi:predicted MFS family arabinose efflux permease
MLQSLIFAFLILTERIEVWHIFSLGFFLGIINAFDIPARQSFVIDVVDDREDLGNAIALNSSLFNAARIFGPSVAGSVIAAIGEGLCFLANGIAHGATVFALLAMHLKPRPCANTTGNILRELSAGVQYAWNAVPLRSVLVLLAVTSFSGWPVLMMLPIFAGKILAGGPQTLGLLLTTFGCGAIVATAYLASRQQVRGIEHIIVGGGLIFGIGLMVFSQSTWLWLSLLSIFFSGFGMIAQVASINTVLQTLVDEDKRGRLMSLYVMSFSGSVPLGSLIAGQIASVIGTPYTLFAGALLCVASSLVFYQYLSTWQAATDKMHAERAVAI